MQIANEKIKNLMKHKSVKATHIARKHEISLASIRSVLYGNSLNPSYKILQAFSEELECPIAELYEDFAPQAKQTDEQLVKEASLYRRILDSIIQITVKQEIQLPPKHKEIIANSIFKASTENSMESDYNVDETLIRWAINRVREKNNY
jgi:transcriptional regulator with XRE-family HTH domain